jgi:hypothetical protein
MELTGEQAASIMSEVVLGGILAMGISQYMRGELESGVVFNSSVGGVEVKEMVVSGKVLARVEAEFGVGMKRAWLAGAAANTVVIAMAITVVVRATAAARLFPDIGGLCRRCVGVDFRVGGKKLKGTGSGWGWWRQSSGWWGSECAERILHLNWLIIGCAIVLFLSVSLQKRVDHLLGWYAAAMEDAFICSHQDKKETKCASDDAYIREWGCTKCNINHGEYSFQLVRQRVVSQVRYHERPVQQYRERLE